MNRLLGALRAAGLVAAAAAMLMWPALVNGRPAVFTDTALYYAEGEYLMEALGLVAPGHGGLPAGDPTRLPDRPGAPNMSADIDGARSPVWGAFLYALQRIGGLWLAAGAQAAAAAAAIYLLYRAALPVAPRKGYLAVMAALAAASSLPIFADLIMPDVFAGVAAVCVLAVLACWDPLSPARRLALLGLLTVSAASHGSIPVFAVSTAAAGAAVLTLTGSGLRAAATRAAMVGLAVAVGMVGLRLAYAPIQRRAGEAMGTPPFLTARVLADGPGRRYLARHCGHDAFEACRFAGERLDDSDVILWSHRRGQGAFSVLPTADRRRMEREDARFALTAIASAPASALAAAVRDTAWQLVLSDVEDGLRDQGYFLRDGFWRRTNLALIIPDAKRCGAPGGCANHVPPIAFSVWEMTVAALTTVALVWRLARADLRKAWRAPRQALGSETLALVRIAVIVLFAMVLNAAICGTLSGPFPRYQARLAWLSPLAAMLLLGGASLNTDRRHQKFISESMT